MFGAKVRVPERRASILRRDRLVSRLSAVRPGRIGTVYAPAGYGKTTLIIDVVRDGESSVSWLSLDEFDRDLNRFLQYLSLAVTGHSTAESERPGSPHDHLAWICSEVSKSDRPMWIVLDDLHTLAGAENVLSTVDYLARRLPESASLLVASRTPPELPSLPRLRAQEQLVEVTSRDLAFTEEEISEWYRAVRQMPIDIGQARKILHITDGWPVAVTSIEPDAASTGAGLDQYIASEVLSRLEPGLRGFLGDAVVLQVLEATACDYILERQDSASLLARLERANIPIVRLEGADTFHVHALLRGNLLNELLLTAPDRARGLERRAGEWYQRAGHPDLAIEHFAAAEEWERCRRLVVEEAPRAYKEGRWHAITTWLRPIPEAARFESADLPLWEARILIRFGRADEALQVIEQVKRQASGISQTTMSELEALRAAAFRIKGDLEAASVSARESLDLALQGDASLTLVAEARKQLGMALFSKGSFEQSEYELRAALEIVERRGDAEEAATCNACLGASLGSLGRLAEGAVHLERAADQWRRIGNAKELSWTLNNLAMTYLQSGQMATARPCLVEAIENAREAGYARAEAYCLASLADLDRLTGDLSRAKSEYEDAIRLAGEIGEPTIKTYGLVGLSDISRQLGEVADAEALANEALANASGRGSAQEEGLARLAMAKLHRHRGEINRGLAEATAAVSLFSAGNSSHEYIESVLLLGELQLDTRRRRQSLLDNLAALADQAHRRGLQNLVAKVGADYPRVLQFAASRKIGGLFYREVLRKISGVREGQPAIDRPASESAFPIVDVRTLGVYEVIVDGRLTFDHEWESAKSKELFVLLLTSKRSLRRDEIIAHIWPEAGGTKASALFHSSLYRVRQATYHAAIVQSSGRYELNPDGLFRWDVSTFRSLVASASRDVSPEVALPTLRSALEVYQGPFLVESDSEWAAAIRDEIDLVFVDVAARLIDALKVQGQGLEAVSICERLLAYDPYSESACSRLLAVALECRIPDVGIKAYEKYQTTLKRDLSEAPSDALRTVFKRLKEMIVSSP